MTINKLNLSAEIATQCSYAETIKQVFVKKPKHLLGIFTFSSQAALTLNSGVFPPLSFVQLLI